MEQHGWTTGICRTCDRTLPQSCIKNKKNNCGRNNCKDNQFKPESISVSQILLNFNDQLNKEVLQCFDISQQIETSIFKDYSQQFDDTLQSTQYQQIGMKIHKYFELRFQGQQIEDEYINTHLGQEFISDVQQWVDKIKLNNLSIEININDRNVFGKPDLIANSHLYDYKFYSYMNKGKIEKCKVQLLLYVMILATYNRFINTISIVDLKRGKLITWNLSNLKIIKIKEFLKQYSTIQTYKLSIDIHMLLQEMFNQCADICRLDDKIDNLEIIRCIQSKLFNLGIESKILYGNCGIQPNNHHWIYIDSVHYDIIKYMQITQITDYNVFQDIRNFDMDFEINNETINLNNQQIIQICDKYCKKIKNNTYQEGKFKKSVQDSKLDNKGKQMLVGCVQEQNDFQDQFEKIFRKQYIQKFGSVDFNQQQQRIELSENAYRYSQNIQLVIDFYKQPPEEITQVIQQNTFRGPLQFNIFCGKMLQYYVDRIETQDQQHFGIGNNILWNSVCDLLKDVEIIEQFKICDKFSNKYKGYLQQFKDQQGCELCHKKKYLITRCCKRKMCYECDSKYQTDAPCPLCGSNMSSLLLDEILSTGKVQKLLSIGKYEQARDCVQYLLATGIKKQQPDDKMKRALEYYKRCMDDIGIQDHPIPPPNPQQWIQNKAVYKNCWKGFYNIFGKNALSVYMDYMCNNF